MFPCPESSKEHLGLKNKRKTTIFKAKGIGKLIKFYKRLSLKLDLIIKVS